MLRSNKTQYLKNFSLISSIYSLNTLGTNILELFLVLVALGLGKGLALNMFGALGSNHQ